MKTIAHAFLAAILFACCTTSLLAAERTIVVLDASGSMWGQIDGKPKVEIARETLKNVLQTIPSDMELGLMAYGHREKGSCEDIELVVPPATGTGAAIAAAAAGMKFLGKTPLSAAVRKAAQDLKYTENKATVILITDGLETCNADPCAIGKELEQAGIDFTAHVVGFGLTAEEGKKVACLAENTGGKYIQASDAKALEEALKVTVAAPPPPPAPAPAPAPEPAKVEFNFTPQVVMAEGGAPLQHDGQAWKVFKVNADGTRGDNLSTDYENYKGNLEPGDYIVEASLGYAASEQKVKIEAGKVAAPLFNLNAGTVVVKPRPSPGADVDSNATLRFRYPGAQDVSTEYGERKLFLPAGEQQLEVQIGEGKVNETFQLAAGQSIEKDVIVGVGRAVINAYYTQGGDKVESSNLSTKIYKAAKKIDGTREQVAYGFGPDGHFDLPAGDYVGTVEMDAALVEFPIVPKVGERQVYDIALKAGVLALVGEGADAIKVYKAAKKIDGSREEVAYGFGDNYQTTLPAGDYVLSVTFKADKPALEQPITVKAGERLEVPLKT